MFNVQLERRLPGLHNYKPPEEFVPGFRVNADNSMSEATAPPPSDLAFVHGLFNGLGSAFVGAATGNPTEDTATGALPASNRPRREACPLVGRVGPSCVYQCSPGDWVSTPLYPSGPCPPFITPGVGTSPWGGRR